MIDADRQHEQPAVFGRAAVRRGQLQRRGLGEHRVGPVVDAKLHAVLARVQRHIDRRAGLAALGCRRGEAPGVAVVDEGIDRADAQPAIGELHADAQLAGLRRQAGQRGGARVERACRSRPPAARTAPRSRPPADVPAGPADRPAPPGARATRAASPASRARTAAGAVQRAIGLREAGPFRLLVAAAVEVHADQVLAAAVGVVEQALGGEHHPARAVGMREQRDPRIERRVVRQPVPAQRAVEQGRDRDRAGGIHRHRPGGGRHRDGGDLAARHGWRTAADACRCRAARRRCRAGWRGCD